jgi:hypothetical protein
MSFVCATGKEVSLQVNKCSSECAVSYSYVAMVVHLLVPTDVKGKVAPVLN